MPCPGSVVVRDALAQDVRGGGGAVVRAGAVGHLALNFDIDPSCLLVEAPAALELRAYLRGEAPRAGGVAAIDFVGRTRGGQRGRSQRCKGD